MNKKKVFWTIILIIAIIVFIGSATYIFLYFMSGRNNNSEFLDNSETTTIEGITNTVAENHNIKWDELEEKNNDIYAWIYIPGTKVDHPIVQPTVDEGDAFYLNRNINKSYAPAGSIYSEIQTAKDFSDPVTLIYGHNMLDESMFASLHRFEDEKFFKKNKYIYVYMPYHKLTYKIYAAYVYDDRHILNSFDFEDEKVLMNYFQYTLNPESMVKQTRKQKLDENSKIITLSTCTNGASNTRYLVQGVLIKDEQTN